MRSERLYSGRATWELRNIVEALSMFEAFNDKEERERLREAKLELARRGKGRL